MQIPGFVLETKSGGSAWGSNQPYFLFIWMATKVNVAIPAIVATTSQNHHGKKLHPLLTLQTTDSKIMDNMPQNIVIAIPAAIKLKAFIQLVLLDVNQISGGSAWGSNPPETCLMPPNGFEVRGAHRDSSAPVIWISIAYRT